MCSSLYINFISDCQKERYSALHHISSIGISLFDIACVSLLGEGLGFLFTMSFAVSALVEPLNLHWLSHSCWVNERVICGYNSHITRVEYNPGHKVPGTINSVYSNLHHDVSRMQLALNQKMWLLVEGDTEALFSLHWFISMSCYKMEKVRV